MFHRRIVTHLLATLALCATTMPAQASCGSAFCTLNTNEDALGPWVKPGLRLDLRAEYVRQDTLRSGTHKVDAAGEPDTHDEVHTLNRNFVASLDYSWSSDCVWLGPGVLKGSAR